MAWQSLTMRWVDVRITSDALYRERGKWISDGLTTLGWTKTADTGQIDWSTATRPGSPTANTKGGYEIRQSTGGSTDVFLKITYGVGYAASGPCIGIWMQTGDGSNGSGTLTGDTTTERQVGSAFGSSTPYESTWYLSGDEDNFVFGGTNENNAQNTVGMGVQRSCNASGVDTNNGWFTWNIGYSGSSVAAYSQYVSFATGSQASDDKLPICAVPRELRSTAAPLLFLPMIVQDGSTYMALRDVIAMPTGVPYAQHDVYHYGATRKFVGIGSSNNTAWWGYTYPLTGHFCVRLT